LHFRRDGIPEHPGASGERGHDADGTFPEPAPPAGISVHPIQPAPLCGRQLRRKRAPLPYGSVVRDRAHDPTTKLRILRNALKTWSKNLRSARIVVTPFARSCAQTRDYPAYPATCGFGTGFFNAALGPRRDWMLCCFDGNPRRPCWHRLPDRRTSYRSTQPSSGGGLARPTVRQPARIGLR